jgi:E3 ubiquitin-protein ligase NEDD4
VVNEMFATAEKRGGEMVTVEFRPGGADISVTEANNVDVMVEYPILKRVKDQLDSFMNGFDELIPHELIKVFDEHELGSLICGKSEIDVYAFRSLLLDFRSTC